MEFEWDELKNQRNIIKHGVAFNHALKIFNFDTDELIDERKDYGEKRIISIGEFEGEIFIVIYTDRLNVRRIISARVANKKERRRWQLLKRL